MNTKDYTNAEMQQILEFCAKAGKACTDCQNMREVENDYRCDVHPALLALKLVARKDAEIKAMRGTLATLITETNDDVCSFCARCRDFELDEDLPDDVAVCPYKREKGVTACVDGIVESIAGWRNG